MNEPNKKVLIVEDDKDYLWILRQSLGRENVTVVFTMDGEAGLEMAEKEKPDLIILDVKLPGMDGIIVAEKLKEKGSKAPIIFLTAYDDPEHISRATEAVKETQYIVKSDLHTDEIVAEVKKKLGIK